VNKATLQYLIAHLIRVEKHADVNKMAIHNLATVFAPNLLQSKDGDMLRMVEDTPLVNGLVNTFIKDFDAIFGEEEPAEAAPLMAKANYDYAAASEKELSFKIGDLIRVIKQGEDKGWWFGEINNKKVRSSSVFSKQVLKLVDSRDCFRERMLLSSLKLPPQVRPSSCKKCNPFVRS